MIDNIHAHPQRCRGSGRCRSTCLSQRRCYLGMGQFQVQEKSIPCFRFRKSPALPAATLIAAGGSNSRYTSRFDRAARPRDGLNGSHRLRHERICASTATSIGRLSTAGRGPWDQKRKIHPDQFARRELSTVGGQRCRDRTSSWILVISSAPDIRDRHSTVRYRQALTTRCGAS